jgi:hypothetical protein
MVDAWVAYKEYGRTYLYIQRVRKSMKSISESCFNDCKTISFMQSLASVYSGLMKCHSWVT